MIHRVLPPWEGRFSVGISAGVSVLPVLRHWHSVAPCHVTMCSMARLSSPWGVSPVAPVTPMLGGTARMKVRRSWPWWSWGANMLDL